jgi:hypothetical protein
MKKNIGTLDKLIRISIATAIVVLYASGVISGTWAIVTGVLALILVFTSFVNYCPLYTPFGFNTTKNKKP